MEDYSALLKFYLMSSIDTGNTVFNLLLAILIPFLINTIVVLFHECFINPVHKRIWAFVNSKTKTSLIANSDTTYGAPLDLNENLVLQEAVIHYTANVVKPTYPFGSYRFTRLAAKGPSAGNMSLADTLRHTYFLQTVPSSEEAVQVWPGLWLQIYDNSNQDKKKDSQESYRVSFMHAGEFGTQNAHGKGTKKQQKTTLVFETKCNAFTQEDVVLKFTQKAFETYKNSIKRAVDRERYLFQPLIQASAARTRRLSTMPAITMCERYLLSHEKTFDTLFFPEKSKLINLIDQFETRTGKFAVPGFPHKMILLFYGPPGTGKTSLVKAIAAHTHRHIVSIPLSHIETNRELFNLMYDGRFSIVNDKSNSGSNGGKVLECLRADKVVYMLEDIDGASEIVRKVKKVDAVSNTKFSEGFDADTNSTTTMNGDTQTTSQVDNSKFLYPAESATSPRSETHSRVERVFIDKKKKISNLLSGVPEDALSLNGLLEAFGGILDAPGRIVVLTTNHIESLAPDLLKPGIITMKLYMGNFNAECGIEMVKHYFPVAMSEDWGEGHENPNPPTNEPLPGAAESWSRQTILHEIADVFLQAQESGRGFSPAEVEQLCAENDTLQQLLEAMKSGSREEFF